MQLKQQSTFSCLLALGALLTTGLLAHAQAPAAAEAPKPPVVAELPKARNVKIAIVDIEKTFNLLDERSQVQADLAVMGEKFSQESEAMNREIKDLEEDLKVLDTSSPAFRAKEEALSKKAFEKQAWMTWRQNTMQREQKLRQLDLYRKINIAAAGLAKENGYDIVMFKEPPIENMARLNPQDQQDAMGNRKLIYFAPDLEITEPLITKMNNEYKNRPALNNAKPGAAAPKQP
jgi:Skp family chaperone for outer membrane proteins